MAAAVVTGAGKGLGKEIARRLVARGYKTWLADVDLAAAEDAAADIGGRAVALDVADAEGCKRVAAEAAAAQGGLEVWVNNAGVLRTGPAWEHEGDAQRAMFAVNAQGTINGTFAALNHMRPAGRGHVVQIVSLAGLIAAPSEAVYGASKHAALAFSVGLATDLRLAGERGVHVSCLCPDGMWTPMLFDKMRDPTAAPSWSGVMLTPQRVADAAIALLDKPRLVLAVPRWRGAFLRVFDAMPHVARRMMPVMMADARRKQRAFAKRHSG